MTNRPKIFAPCKAGCLWETVHKADFEQSASIIRQYKASESTEHASNGYYILEQGKRYKIVCPLVNGYFKGIVSFLQPHGTSSSIVKKSEDEYAKGFTFCLLDQIHTIEKDDSGIPYKATTELVYEYAGKRYREVINREDETAGDITVLLRPSLDLTEDKECQVFLYNEDATIILDGGGTDSDTLARIAALEEALGSYITDIDELIGGDS